MTATLAATNVRRLARTEMSEAEWQTRVELAACYRLADRFGFSDIVWNHITARIPGPERHFLINPFGLRYDEITASSLVKVDLEGNILAGGETNVTGFIIHSAIHARREDVTCVFHSHCDAGLQVSCLAEGLLPLVQDGLMLYDDTAYHAYEGLATDESERERLAEHLGQKKCLILRNHGLLTVGETVGEAFMLMRYLDRACRTQMAVLATGRPYIAVPPAMRRHGAAQYQHFPPGKYEWPALVRLLDQQDPGYKT